MTTQRDIAEQIQREHGIVTGFITDLLDKPLDDHIKNALFYAAREALFNVVKHSRAKHADLSICREADQVIIKISDDGIGFNWKSSDFPTDRAGGFGLFNIRERLDLLGGRLEVHTNPSGGTSIILSAPLKQQGP